MGSRLMRRAPRYVHGFIDRHGKPRFYFRRRGFSKVPLPGLPWSPEFMEAYEAALAGQRLPIAGPRPKPGTIRAVAVSYFASPTFSALAPLTRSTRRNTIERFCRQEDQDGKPLGDKRVATLKREHVIKQMAARADKPESANNFRKSLRALMQHAIEMELREDDPTRDVRAIRMKGDGYHSWTDDEIAAFERHHPSGSRARLALALLLYTGQRRGDVVRMGRQHVRDGAIAVRQEKTRAALTIPLHPELAAIIDDAPADNLTFLTTAFGRPFTAAGFGNWFREQCDDAGLKHCASHGLRKAVARRLAEAGCTEKEIAAITGHASLREVARYTKAADQVLLARAAMEKVSRTSSGKLSTVSQKQGKKR
jgi:integrase